MALGLTKPAHPLGALQPWEAGHCRRYAAPSDSRLLPRLGTLQSENGRFTLDLQSLKAAQVASQLCNRIVILKFLKAVKNA